MQRREWDELVRGRPRRPPGRRPALAVLGAGAAFLLGAVLTGSDPGGLDRPAVPEVAHPVPGAPAPPTTGAPPPPASTPPTTVAVVVVPAPAPARRTPPPPPPVAAPPTTEAPPTPTALPPADPVAPTTTVVPDRSSWVPGVAFPETSNRPADPPNERAAERAGRGRSAR